jgi:hypothetical protein
MFLSPNYAVKTKPYGRNRPYSQNNLGIQIARTKVDTKKNDLFFLGVTSLEAAVIYPRLTKSSLSGLRDNFLFNRFSS